MAADAKIKVGIDGLEESIGGMQRLRNAIEGSIGNAPKAWANLGTSIGESVKTGISDIGRLVNVANGITFVGTIESARQFRLEATKMSVATGEGIKSIQARIDTLASRHIIAPERVAAFTAGMRKMTGDTEYAKASFAGLADEAIATGRSAEEMAPLGATLHNVMGVSGDTTDALGRIRATAESFGNVGGPMALQNSLVALNDILGQVDMSSEGARDKMVAFVASMQSATDPTAGARKASTIMGKIAADPLQLMRTLHMNTGDIYDLTGPNKGHMKDPLSVMEAIQKKGRKIYGTGEGGRRAFINGMGSVESGLELFDHDFGKDREVAKQAALHPSTAAQKAAADFANSDAGRAEKAHIDAGIKAREMAEPIVKVLEEIKGLLGEHPILGGAAVNAGAGLLGNVASGGTSAAFKGTASLAGAAATATTEMIGGVSASLGVGSAAAAGIAAAGVTAAAAIGYALGTGGDILSGKVSKLFGGSGRSFSDMLAGTQTDGSDKPTFVKDTRENSGGALVPDSELDPAMIPARSGPAAATTPAPSSGDNAPSASPGGNGDNASMPPIEIKIMTGSENPVDAMTSYKNASVKKQ